MSGLTVVPSIDLHKITKMSEIQVILTCGLATCSCAIFVNEQNNQENGKMHLCIVLIRNRINLIGMKELSSEKITES